MERYRLKNIIILILLLLNLFLLFMVGNRLYARQQAQAQLVEETIALLSYHGISIDAALLEENDAPAAYACKRSADEERTFVEALLGEILVESDAGSGTCVYYATYGTATFRANGSFTLEIQADTPEITDYSQFLQSFCPANYTLAERIEHSDSVTFCLEAAFSGCPVYGAAMEVVLTNGHLSAASGYLISTSAEPVDNGTAMTRCSAAVRLMDDCREEGRICNTISDISAGYLLQSTTSTPLLLTPIYRFETNTYDYYVTAATGHVSPVR